MQSKAKNADQYLTDVPAERCAALATLRKLTRTTAPAAKEDMLHGMPAYLLGDMFCAVASQKNYMALYVCEGDIVKAHAAQLRKVSCGKGCIRFKRIADLNLAAMESILREILERRKRGAGSGCR